MKKSNIVNFPSPVQIDDNDDFGYAYEDQNIISKDKCFKCGKEIDYMQPLHEQIWNIQGQAEYGSKLDGSYVNISICDECLMKFLGIAG